MNKKLSQAALAKKLSSAIGKADRYFNKFIVLRDGKCILCGSVESGQCSHYYGKRACPATRYDEDNAHRMCSACHLRHHKIDNQVYSNWMRHHYSEAKLDALECKAGLDGSKDIAYYEEIAAKYKELVLKMASDGDENGESVG